MKQHSVPQEIMSVEFKLFGAMTLRQFGYVAGAGGIGYFLYLIMPGILKWPLAGICVLFGLALAFIPINDRPLDQYVTNFLISLRNPTRRVWKKTAKIPSFLIDTSEQIKAKSQGEQPVVLEKKTMEGSGVFSGERKSVKTDEESEIEKEMDTLMKDVSQKATVVTAQPEPAVNAATKSILESSDETLQSENSEDFLLSTSSNVVNPTVIDAKEPLVADSSTPSLTNAVNTINGMVTDASGKPIAGAVVIVKNEIGKPVQAIKTNQRGEFLPGSPLSQGHYIIDVQYIGLNFDSKSLLVDGNVIPLIKFTAKQNL